MTDDLASVRPIQVGRHLPAETQRYLAQLLATAYAQGKEAAWEASPWAKVLVVDKLMLEQVKGSALDLQAVCERLSKRPWRGKYDFVELMLYSGPFTMAGKQVVVVDEWLADALLRTDLPPGVTSALPWSTFYVHVRGQPWLRGFWVTEVTEQPDMLHVVLVYEGPGGAVALTPAMMTSHTLLVPTAAKIQEAAKRLAALVVRKTGDNVDDVVRLFPTVTAAARAVEKDAHMAYTLLAGLLLYLRSVGPDVRVVDHRPEARQALERVGRAKGVAKKRQAEQMHRRTPDVRVSYIGTRLRGTVLRAGESTGTKAAHWRRGHFHTYLFGPRKKGGEPLVQERRLLWVAPVPVGGGEIRHVTHVRKVHNRSKVQPGGPALG